MGSRLISYYPIVFRICEQMIMGNILDAISLRSCNPKVVGHMNPVDYFQLMYEDELEAHRPIEVKFEVKERDSDGNPQEQQTSKQVVRSETTI